MKTKWISFNILSVIISLFFLWGSNANAQMIDDITLSYSFVNIDEVTMHGKKMKPTFYRHYTGLTLGIGHLSIGGLFQRALKGAKAPGKEEDGIMLTAGYDLILSKNVRLEIFGKVGVLSETNSGQPLYATDTDFRGKLIFYSYSGKGSWLNHRFFPSAYIGSIMNNYGRKQIIAGFGTWWSNIGFYFTGFRSLNGVIDHLNPGKNKDVLFAYLRESGISISFSLDIKNLQVRLKQNFPFENGGNDLELAAQYQIYLN